MAPLATKMLMTLMQLSVEHEASTHAGTHDHAEHYTIAFPRAIQRFAQSKAIGIIGNA